MWNKKDPRDFNVQLWWYKSTVILFGPKYSGVEQGGQFGHICMAGWRTTDNIIGLVLVYDDGWLRNHRQLIIKHVEAFFSLKRGLILRVVHSHRQRVWAHPGTSARTLAIGPGVCETSIQQNSYQNNLRTTHCIRYDPRRTGEHVNFRCLRVDPRRTT